MVLEAIHVEFAQRQHILVVHDVDDEVARQILDHMTLLCTLVQLKHIHGAANRYQNGHQDHHKLADVVESLDEELDVEGALAEDSKPIEYFDPGGDESEGRNQSLRLQAEPAVDLQQVDNQHVEGSRVREDVDVVEGLRQIVFERLLGGLHDFNSNLYAKGHRESYSKQVSVPEVLRRGIIVVAILEY